MGISYQLSNIFRLSLKLYIPAFIAIHEVSIYSRLSIVQPNEPIQFLPKYLNLRALL